MWKEQMVELRGIVEPNGKRAQRAAEIVAQVKSLPDILSELRSICDASGAAAHRTAELVNGLLALPEWIDGEHGGLRDQAEAELDRLCRMIALTIDELLAMIKFFPEPARWEKADLVRLRDEAVGLQKVEDDERRAKARASQQRPIGTGMSSNGRHPEPPPDVDPAPRQVVTELASEFDRKLKEKQSEIIAEKARVAKQEEQIGQMHAKTAQFQTELVALRKQVRELKAENAVLKAENAKLKKRIAAKAKR